MHQSYKSSKGEVINRKVLQFVKMTCDLKEEHENQYKNLAPEKRQRNSEFGYNDITMILIGITNK